MKTSHKLAAVAVLVSGLALAAQSQTVIGSWQSAPIPPTPANDEGWQRGQGGFGPNGSIFASSNSPAIFELKTNVVAGYAQSLDIHETGFGNARLFISLSPAQIQAFTNNSQLNFTFSCDSSVNSGVTGGFMQMVQFQCNSAGGFKSPSINTGGGFSETGDTNNNSSGQPVYFFGSNSPARSQVVTWNYGSFLSNSVVGSGFVQLVFIFQVGGGAPTNVFINNVTLSSPQTQIVYTVDDFATNGVGPTNPTNDDFALNPADYSQGGITGVWSEWFGTPLGGISFDPNVNVSGNTNTNGAMALALNWNAATDGFQQFVVWHGNSQSTFVPVPGGTAGIRFPRYTNVECDVMFDPSSLSTTNTNGVLGVIRIGVRGNGAFSQDWLNGGSITISDTNWHHISAPLNSSNPDFGNIADVIIGEDVTSFVAGGVASNGLTGSQILYVDNIRLTGPVTAPVIPPPTVQGPMKASPGLRIFAGSAANTFDREMLYTVDQNQSWVDPSATFPVKYSFSLLDFNPNIQQTMVELIGGGSTPTSFGEFADFSGPTTFWLTLNPAAVAGEVVASVQWKTNLPGANPNVTATRFTNSTAIGTWSLVFTSVSNGFVVAPGSVIGGSTNFTVTDTNVTNDFAEPVFVGFGLQPNTAVGEGAFEDWGMMSVSGVVNGNEFEDFTHEGSDISGGLTPSGLFNNGMSALPAGLIIQKTNDAFWLNWTQPAAGFTLTSATNLKSTNWINPGFYSGYTDTNAPRVMPLVQAFAGKFWVLLPSDDLPTASGSANPNPPAAGPLAPNAFFKLSTNVISP